MGDQIWILNAKKAFMGRRNVLCTRKTGLGVRVRLLYLVRANV